MPIGETLFGCFPRAVSAALAKSRCIMPMKEIPHE